ncbi:uncharacterized protein [Diadema antillarum]|uniref:uncharacterized protein n=1 Tax=Diadema antillarum TaxID=105358 RepID=UPI003A875001
MAVACDTRDTWYHTDCMGMSSESYDRINKSNVSWICAACDSPNHSLSVLDSYLSESDNKFQVLSDIENSSNQSGSSTPSGDESGVQTTSHHNSKRNQDLTDSLPNPGSPVYRSSPIKSNSNAETKRRKIVARPLKILSANLQSMNAKREAFWEAVESSQPDIIIANETWLKPSMLNSEMMPPGYNAPVRKDRHDGYGGVLLATKHDLVDCEIDVKSDCELVATKIQVYGQQPLIVMSVYRPPKNDLEYAQSLCQSIQRIMCNNPSAVVWISGDFNLPDISWDTCTITGHQYSVALNNYFISMFNDVGLSQSVDFPTRGDKTLDLFLTNRPSLLSKCVPMPGVSDHDMVLALSDVRAKRQKPAPRRVFLWRKADFDNIRAETLAFSKSYMESNSTNTNVDQLWRDITSFLHKVLETMVPSKLSSPASAKRG